MPQAWYYADSRHQQQGPVDGSVLRSAFERGEINATTLVWREGLANWLPLSQVAAEIGLSMAAPASPPPRPAAPSPRSGTVVATPTKGAGGAGILVIVLIVGFFGIVVLGILAAIAVPAYADYTTRARVSQAMLAGENTRAQIEEYNDSQGQCPNNDSEGFGSPESFASTYVASIDIGRVQHVHCGLRMTLRGFNDDRVDGHYVSIGTDADGRVVYDSNVPSRYLPTRARAGTR
jgi:type IV pilus assembly protein PilA